MKANLWKYGAVLAAYCAVNQGVAWAANLDKACQDQDPFLGRTVQNGQTVCLPNNSRTYLSIGNTSNVSSFSITTGYGSGDLNLYAKNGGWPKLDGSDPSSVKAGNGECIVISNPSNYWSYITVDGASQGASLVVDLGATSCRTVDNTIPPDRDDRYEYDYVNLKVFRFQFSDTPLEWSTMLADLDKTVQYYTEQSYGKFSVYYDVSEPVITINRPKRDFDNDFFAWRAAWQAEVKNRGVDPDNPGKATVVMMVAPQVGNFNSSAAPPSISLYHHTPGVIAHELGHALGLRHAKAIEAGAGRVIGDHDYDKESLNYGNVYSMMGMGAHSLQSYNLLYKHYFRWLTDSDVPVINSSGTYRIYAFDHARNDLGYIGLRLKSGNGLYTYWLEYRTTNQNYPKTKDGILINLQGYFENEKDARFWKTTSYLLDMTPGSKTPGWWGDDQTDSELVIGKSYTDHWGGFRITPTAKGGVDGTERAWIEVKVELLSGN
ncbi:PPC domain-containing protein [Pseudoalteromonas sp. Of7M-16]|uniref:PPC domain-containing protein n=1 Tax=Pseudoalteromonas sp. Of7M-16 TaxID=2917756 RepID=UPI001EF5AA6E|nr:PPC domain-containing protein [Pseudoalteromonas sp. Of7M-16]MCG7547553.1 collagenase [Pseudoalteromonas sp. Of7M-16]